MAWNIGIAQNAGWDIGITQDAGSTDIIGAHTNLDCQFELLSHSGVIDVYGIHTNIDSQFETFTHSGVVGIYGIHINVDCQLETLTHLGSVGVKIVGIHNTLSCKFEILQHTGIVTVNFFNTITNNIKNTFHGQSITYNGSAKTITCERERTVNVIDNRYPFVKLSGPVTEVLHRSRIKARVDLHYLIEFVDNSIDDSYDPNVTVNPITKVLGTVEADLLVMAMADRKRGGFANNTEWEGAGYYFDDSDGVSLFVKWIQLRVEVNVLESDPHYR